MMPVNNLYSIEELMKACKYYIEKLIREFLLNMLWQKITMIICKMQKHWLTY